MHDTVFDAAPRPAVQPRAGRTPHRARRYAPLVAVAVVAIVAACGNSTQSPTTPLGTTSIAEPATGSPAASIAAETAAPAATPAGSPSGSAAPSASASPLPYPLPGVQVQLQPYVKGLDSPVAAVSAGDARLFVVEQTGRIVVVAGGRVTGTFLDVSGRVSCCGERGLLGLAFDPAYASNGRFYVRYTDPTGDVRIAEFRRSSDPNRADPASERLLLTIPHRTYPNHNGGTIAFGPDGYLYVGTGDGGGSGDPNGNGQKLGVLLGKMLRIDVSRAGSGTAYAIPSTNPFVGTKGARGEIWAYGVRNPYGFSFDRATGDLWIADVGQNLYEEVDRATAAAGLGRGANYGWSVMEASHCYKPSSGCSTAGKVLPLAEYSHGAGSSTGCAVIGGFVYRGTQHPELAGRYFLGDDCSGRIWDLDAGGPAHQNLQQLADTSLQITGWGQGSDGELYVAAADGTLYHLV